MSERNDPDYLHPDGKPDGSVSLDDLPDNEKYSDSSKRTALHEADGHSIDREDEFLGTEGKRALPKAETRSQLP
jgi:hypothetical protein